MQRSRSASILCSHRISILCLLLANQFIFMRRVYTDIVNCPDRAKYALHITPSMFLYDLLNVARVSHSESFWFQSLTIAIIPCCEDQMFLFCLKKRNMCWWKTKIQGFWEAIKSLFYRIIRSLERFKSPPMRQTPFFQWTHIPLDFICSWCCLVSKNAELTTIIQRISYNVNAVSVRNCFRYSYITS